MAAMFTVHDIKAVPFKELKEVASTLEIAQYGKKADLAARIASTKVDEGILKKPIATSLKKPNLGDSFNMDFTGSNGQAYGPGLYFGLLLHTRTFVGDTRFRMTEENFLGQELDEPLVGDTRFRMTEENFLGQELDEPLTEELMALTEELMAELAYPISYSGLSDNAIVVHGPNLVAANAEEVLWNEDLEVAFVELQL